MVTCHSSKHMPLLLRLSYPLLAIFLLALGCGQTTAAPPESHSEERAPENFAPAPFVAAARIASYEGSTCVVETDVNFANNVRCWGVEQPPMFLTTSGNAQSVAMGDLATCVLDGANDVTCWRRNTSHEQFRIETKAAAVAVGRRHLCIVALGGDVWCGGSNSQQQLGLQFAPAGPRPLAPTKLHRVVFASETPALEIVAGTLFSCARLNDESVHCWGDNSLGQLGQGASGPSLASSAPVRVPLGDKKAIGLIAGNEHACAALADGTVQCWGGNEFAQIGESGATVRGDTPHQIARLAPGHSLGKINSLGRIQSLGSGGWHTCVTFETTGAACWGLNNRSQFTSAWFTETSSEPMALEEALGQHVVAIVGGRNHTCVVLDDGTLRCRGDARAFPPREHLAEMRVAEPTMISVAEPLPQIATRHAAETRVDLPWDSAFSASNVPGRIAAGIDDLCWLADDGAVECQHVERPTEPTSETGARPRGEAAAGDLLTKAAEAQAIDVPFAETSVSRRYFGAHAASIHGYGRNFCALTSSGDVWCWGPNEAAQLGAAPDMIDTADRPMTAAIRVPLDVRAVGIAVGLSTACALDKKGQVRCWGDNRLLQRGVAPAQTSLAPVHLLAPAISISGGRAGFCAIIVDGRVKCWGDEEPRKARGPQPPPAIRTIDLGGKRARSIALGDRHGCAVLEDSSARCWGDQTVGQLGSIVTPPGDAFAPPSDGLPAVFEVAAGRYHSCARVARKASRRPEPGAASFVSSSVVDCWGSGRAGQLGWEVNLQPAPLGLPEFEAEPTAIAAGYGQTCVALANRKIACFGKNWPDRIPYGDWAPGGKHPHGSMSSSRERPPSYNSSQRLLETSKGGPSDLGAACAEGLPSEWSSDEVFDPSTLPSAPSLPDDPLDSSQEHLPSAPTIGAHQLAAGSTFICSRDAEGVVWCSQFGHQYVRVTLAAPATSIAAGGNQACALLSNRTMACWELSPDQPHGPHVGAAIPLPLQPVAMSVGDGYACAILSQFANVKCWGRNDFGQLGIGSRNPFEKLGGLSVQLRAGTNPIAIATGPRHACVQLDAGQRITCWGANESGQLGTSDTITRKAPLTTPIHFAELTTALALGDRHSCALLGDERVTCWGANDFGQVGRDDVSTTYGIDVRHRIELKGEVTAIAAGDRHTCALMRHSGIVNCWGANDHHQITGGDEPYVATPRAIATTESSDKPIHIVASKNRTCVSHQSGAVYCYGEGF